ncbi:hypothetical protein K505DRAFT_360085 [Melanomma pulvis-pyrius CBS 109.77]|uniref:Uncharacterized protein n=1 Tax=Melanomma pulvis-pyrius CBS 109.77 TaxID=1314802 RepID=A0A6A6XHL9_9PLEO|nr:hypothetical protein K505DRAFT_360085 [Melanomma pulvis-pyrius CBS 109.77]
MSESDTEDAKSDIAHRSHHATRTGQHSSFDSDNSSDKLSQAAEHENLQSPQDEPLPHSEDFNNPFTPPVLEGIEYAQDTSWDHVTHKFQEARAAMYGSYVPELVDPQRGSGNEQLLLQEQLPKAGNLIGHDGDMAVMNPYYQQRPLCGASIGAYRGEHLPPVSLGGIILVDGEPYGLTVHHILDVPSDDESDDQETRKTRQWKPPPVPTDDENQHEETSYPKVVRPTDVDDNEQSVPNHDLQMEETGDSRQSSLPPLDSLAGWNLELSDDEPLGLSDDEPFVDFASDSEFSDSDVESISDSIRGEAALDHAVGDIPGIPPGEGYEIVITQPAIDDVPDDFFPDMEVADEDHLSAHTFGHVYASSGIRRWKRDDVLHEIDWALIKVDPARLQLYNIVQGGRRFSPESKPEVPPPFEEPILRRHYTQEEDEYPMEVVPADSLGGLDVHCFGRTTGLQGGRIGPSMTSLRIYRRKTFSRSWYVTGGFGVGGDTGAWVIENGTGRVCGIALAWSEREKFVYIMPMEIILEDIKRTLGAKDVCLPRFKAREAL